MVFEITSIQERFSLHVENKKDTYKFKPGQAAAYAPRARYMLNKKEYLSHSSFQIVLLAPMSFYNRYTGEAALFDIFISYEEIAHFLPAFAIV